MILVHETRDVGRRELVTPDRAEGEQCIRLSATWLDALGPDDLRNVKDIEKPEQIETADLSKMYQRPGISDSNAHCSSPQVTSSNMA